jgi:N-acetylmuramoyl-L-alanine amidase
MGVIPYNEEEMKLLARLIRAEAERKLGMPMVGNVGVSRTRVRCFHFKDVNTIRKMVVQIPLLLFPYSIRLSRCL